MNQSSILDIDYLVDATFGDAALQREVLALFVAQSERLLKELEGLSDPDAIMRITHTLVGSARGIGAKGVAYLAGQAEAAARNNTVPDVAVLVDAIHQTTGFIARHLQSLIDTP